MNQTIKERIQALTKPSNRKLTLFACGCVREIWHLLSDNRSKQGVIAAESYVDGLISYEELNQARVASGKVWDDFGSTIAYPIAAAYHATLSAFAWDIIYVTSACFCAASIVINIDKAIIKQNQIFDDIFNAETH